MTAKRPRVFLTRRLPLEVLERLRAAVELDVWESDLPPSEEQLCHRVDEAEGLLSLLTDPVTAAVLASAPSLRVISNMATGTDNIDLQAATARGIPIGNTPGVLTETTADFAFALLLAAARRLVEGDRFVRAGGWRTWDPNLLLGQDLHRATLGIVGYGAIGQALARRALGFQMQVLYVRRSPVSAELPGTQVSLEELLRRSDFVSLHLPLTPQTRHYMGLRELQLMKPGAVLVNTARGPVIDQGALVQVLRSGHLSAAALDVTEVEPIDLRDALLELPNVIVTPHIASASRATRLRMAHLAVDNLLAGLEERPLPHCANPEVYGGSR